MVFGNAGNDISMLELTPWSFAVKNATESVKKVAQFITDSNNDDGVAKALEKYILKSLIGKAIFISLIFMKIQLVCLFIVG